MDERRAIERLKGGDPGGLENLVKAHQVRAVRATYLICRDRPLAEDVVQGAFVEPYEKIETFDGRRPFGPWFRRMVVNDAIRAASRRERTTRHGGGSPVALLEDPGTGPHELLEEAEERRRVRTTLAKLPPAQRDAVVERSLLKYDEGPDDGVGSAPRELGDGCWSLGMAAPVEGRSSVTVANLEGMPTGPPDPEQTVINPETIHGP
jgi:RNA polymerase sigma-70 factor, ECF subfamily